MEYSNDPVQAAIDVGEYYKSNHERIIWLGPGLYWRKNEDFSINFKGKDVDEDVLKESISAFYNQFILNKKKVNLDVCCATRGCIEGVEAGLKYFFSESKKKVLYLVPIFDPLLKLCPKSRKVELGHFNESWNKTLENISWLIKNKDVGCIVIANPNNPSGIMYPKGFLKDLSKICNKKEVWILEDGAYFLHCHHSHQTSVLDYFDFCISFIGSTKLFLSFHNKIGGAVLSSNLNVENFTEKMGYVSNEDKFWYNSLLEKVLDKKELLKEHLDYAYKISKDVKTEFLKFGFVSLYFSFFCSIKKTPVGPVMSFGYKNKEDKFIDSKLLFKILAEEKIITQMLTNDPKEKVQGVRLNTRAIYFQDLSYLRDCLKRVYRRLNP